MVAGGEVGGDELDPRSGGALLITGLLDPPAALGLGLAYEALRRWNTDAPAGPQSIPTAAA